MTSYHRLNIFNLKEFATNLFLSAKLELNCLVSWLVASNILFFQSSQPERVGNPNEGQADQDSYGQDPLPSLDHLSLCFHHPHHWPHPHLGSDLNSDTSEGRNSYLMRLVCESQEPNYYIRDGKLYLQIGLKWSMVVNYAPMCFMIFHHG